MKANLRKILALVLSLVLLAVPTGAVCGEAVDPAEEPDPSESTEAVEQLLDELTYFQTMVKNSTLPQYLIDMILKFFGSAEEEQILVKEDGTLMTDEELLQYMIGEMVTMIVTIVTTAVKVIQMVADMANSLPAADAEAEAAA